jgi:hypothetical protein
MRVTLTTGLAGGALVSLLALTAVAQQPTVRVRGAIERVEGSVLKVMSREGANLSIRLAENATVVAVVKASLNDIKPGSYIGVGATSMPDGTLRAAEVHIFPEAMRGTGEGHRPWDLLPESTMTNATVADTVSRVEGPLLTLKYKDGEKKVFVPPETPIVTYAPGERSELKPGAKIFISAAQRQTDGSLLAVRVAVGRGIDPPM